MVKDKRYSIFGIKFVSFIENRIIHITQFFNMLKNITSFIFCCLLLTSAYVKDSTWELKQNYIEQYKDIAIAEMYRTGIPASITLAQGLLESQHGTSRLAVNANNHFGIKCKDYWTGQKYFHKDDDYSKSGELLESCFRQYDSVLESYIDHSNFLVNTPHYSELFSFDRKEFAKWAWGLKKCGYATDKNYPVKLIKLIEEFELYNYDDAKDPWKEILK